MQVSRLTATRRIRQTAAPGSVGPRPKGEPAALQIAQVMKPPRTEEMIPAEVAFFQ